MSGEAALDGLRARLAEDTGWAVPPGQTGDFRRRVAAAAQEAGFPDPVEYAAHLLQRPLGGDAIERLARHLTVGETHFFRDRATFDALAHAVIPALIHRRTAVRRLRIWSAGCCTGEEPYSLAMLVDRLVPDWDVEILATDINPEFLERAQAGEYGPWSFRGAPDWIRARHFTAGRDGRLVIASPLRERVRFLQHNLAADPYPAGIDLILCRNVLMYFTDRQARSTVARMRSALAADGYLSVSPAEASAVLFRGFAPVTFGDALFHTPADAAPVRPETTTPAAAPLRHGRRAPRARTATDAGARSAPVELADPLGRARACADAGRLDEAAAWCARATDRMPDDVDAHFLAAAIALERDDLDDATRALRRVLYLDERFVAAHVLLAEARRRQGRERDAQRHLAAADALLAAGAPEAPVREFGGLNARRLRDMVIALRGGNSA